MTLDKYENFSRESRKFLKYEMENFENHHCSLIMWMPLYTLIILARTIGHIYIFANDGN